MRPRSPYPPQTPAERQAKCRAIKRGEWHYAPELPCDNPPHIPPPRWERQKALLAQASQSALPPAPAMPALPAPPVTAIQKSAPAALATPRKGKAHRADDAWRMSLPPAVGARLQSLLDRHESGDALTAAERAEAEGLLDIADFFIFHLRQRLAA